MINVVLSNKCFRSLPGSDLALTEIEEEDLEDEFTKLELEIESQPSQGPTKIGMGNSTGIAEVSVATNALSDALSNLSLKDGAALESVTEYSVKTTSKNPVSKDANLEPA